MHSHLNFLNHSETKLEVSFPRIGDFPKDGVSKSDNRLPIQKHADIVDYLQRSSRDTRVTAVDILRDCQVDLEGTDYYVLDMIKNNPKIDIIDDGNGAISFQYRTKFEIRNRYELLNTIDRVKSGISWKDIEDCYLTIGSDVQEMIMSGDIIAVKNKETRVQIFYPRGKPFLTLLTGEVTANPNEQYILTREDLRHEIRRGDAIRVNNSWFRVASNISRSASASGQPARARAPTSVTSVEELSERNEYLEDFSKRRLPLDGEFDGDAPFAGRAVKHGCSNDLREKWKLTTEAMKPFRDEKSLEKELLTLNLLTKLGTSSVKKQSIVDTSKRIKARARRVSTKITNTHLKGTAIGAIIAATPDYE